MKRALLLEKELLVLMEQQSNDCVDIGRLIELVRECFAATEPPLKKTWIN